MGFRKREVVLFFIFFLALSSLIFYYFQFFGMSGRVFFQINSDIDIYVSTNGSDDNQGTIESPFKTLEMAKLEVRNIDKTKCSSINIYLREGVYFLDNTLEFDSRDSGTSNCKVIFRSYPNEKVIISGGRLVTDWNKIGDIWVANVSNLKTRQMYINDQRAIRARTEVTFTPIKTSNGYRVNIGIQNDNGMEFVAKRRWEQIRCPIKSTSQNNLILDSSCFEYIPLSKSPWELHSAYIENSRNFLDKPGEWYLDENVGKIYYLPKLNEIINQEVIILPVLETLIHGKDTSYIEFRGLTFSHATWNQPSKIGGFVPVQANVYHISSHYSSSGISETHANILFEDSENIVFQGNVFSHLGAEGIAFQSKTNKNVRANKVLSNEFYDISASAVRIGVVRKDWSYHTSNNEVSNNYIHNVSVEYLGGPGIIIGYTQNTLVLNNNLENLPYTGISIGWGWLFTQLGGMSGNKIKFNHINNIMNELVDGGGVYTLSYHPGMEIAYNFIENQKKEYGAIYLDKGSKGITIFNNVLFNNVRDILEEASQGNTFSNNFWQGKFSKKGKNVFLNNQIISTLNSQEVQAIIKNAGVTNVYYSLRAQIPERSIKDLLNTNNQEGFGVDNENLTVISECLIDCNDSNPCTNDLCINNQCVYFFNTNSCNDGMWCTINDVCSNGVCKGIKRECHEDKFPCSTVYCDEERNRCLFDISKCQCKTDADCQKNNDTCLIGFCDYGNCAINFTTDLCDDLDNCTINDRCVNGFCLGTKIEIGDDDNETEDLCLSNGTIIHLKNNSEESINQTVIVGDDSEETQEGENDVLEQTLSENSEDQSKIDLENTKRSVFNYKLKDSSLNLILKIIVLISAVILVLLVIREGYNLFKIRNSRIKSVC